MISAIAGRLRRMGLPTDAIVGIQMPNIVEQVLTFSRRAARRIDRGAAAAVVAPRRRRHRAGAARRQGADRLPPRRRLRTLSIGRARRRRGVFDPLRVRLRRQPARRRGGARRSIHRGEARSRAAARARCQCRRASCGDDVRGRRGWAGAGGAPPSRTIGRRIMRAVGSWARTGRQHTVSHCACLVRRHLPDAGALAPDRRHAVAASPVRCRGLRAPAPRRARRHADPARRGGVSPRRDRAVRARRADDGARRLARAGAACGERRMARTRRGPRRCADFRRGGLCRGAARLGRPAAADPARSDRRAARGQRRGGGRRTRRV